MATKTKDQIVQELFQIVQEKKKEIAKAEKPKWETNCSFSYEDSSVKFNLQTISDVSVLINILAHLTLKQTFFNQAAKELGIEKTFKWQGFTYNEWKSDIQTRINKIEIGRKKAELEDYEQRLDKLVSPEMKEALELAELQKLITK